jgi:hypothetical protein
VHFFVSLLSILLTLLSLTLPRPLSLSHFSHPSLEHALTHMDFTPRTSVNILWKGVVLLVPCGRSVYSKASSEASTPRPYLSPLNSNTPDDLTVKTLSREFDGSSTRRGVHLLQLSIRSLGFQSGDFVTLKNDDDNYHGPLGGIRKKGTKSIPSSSSTARQSTSKRPHKNTETNTYSKSENLNPFAESDSDSDQDWGGRTRDRSQGGSEWGYDKDRPSARPNTVTHIRRYGTV